MEANSIGKVMELPKGIEGFEVNASCDVDSELQLVESRTGTEFVDYNSNRVNYVEELRVKGPTPVDLDLRIENYAGEQDTAVLAFRYAGLGSCADGDYAALGCEDFDEAEAEAEVLRWSCWAKEHYSSADEAWGQLCAPKSVGFSGTVPWSHFGGVWAKWPARADNKSWQYAFHHLDTDGDQELSKAELAEAYGLCPDADAPEATAAPPVAHTAAAGSADTAATTSVAASSATSSASSSKAASAAAHEEATHMPPATGTGMATGKTSGNRPHTTGPMPVAMAAVAAQSNLTTITTTFLPLPPAHHHTLLTPLSAILSGASAALLGLLCWARCCRQKGRGAYCSLPDMDPDDAFAASTARFSSVRESLRESVCQESVREAVVAPLETGSPAPPAWLPPTPSFGLPRWPPPPRLGSVPKVVMPPWQPPAAPPWPPPPPPLWQQPPPPGGWYF